MVPAAARACTRAPRRPGHVRCAATSSKCGSGQTHRNARKHRTANGAPDSHQYTRTALRRRAGAPRGARLADECAVSGEGGADAGLQGRGRVRPNASPIRSCISAAVGIASASASSARRRSGAVGGCFVQRTVKRPSRTMSETNPSRITQPVTAPVVTSRAYDAPIVRELELRRFRENVMLDVCAASPVTIAHTKRSPWVADRRSWCDGTGFSVITSESCCTVGSRFFHRHHGFRGTPWHGFGLPGCGARVDTVTSTALG